MQQLFFGKTELATRYNCHAITISRWVKCGRLPEPEQQGPAKGKFDIRKVEKFEQAANDEGEE